MTIMTTNCLGGFLYNRLSQPYQSPLIWSMVSNDDFIALAQRYYDIDFKNAEFTVRRATVEPEHHGDVVWARVDGVLDVQFLHFRVDQRCHSFKIVNRPRRYACWDRRMIDHVKDQWLRRSSRMAGAPVFILYTTSGCPLDASAADAFLSMEPAEDHIVVTDSKQLFKSISGKHPGRVLLARDFESAVVQLMPSMEAAQRKRESIA